MKVSVNVLFWIFMSVLCVVATIAMIKFGHALEPEWVFMKKRELEHYVGQHKALWFLSYVVIHLLFAFLPFPWLSSLSFVGGFLFGFSLAFFSSLVLSVLGGTATFLVLRKFLSPFVQRHFYEVLKKVDFTATQNFKLLLSMRMFPFLPFFTVTALFSQSKISPLHFFLGSLIGRSPIVFMYVWVGHELKKLENFQDLLKPDYFFVLLVLAFAPWVKSIVLHLKLQLKKIISPMGKG